MNESVQRPEPRRLAEFVRTNASEIIAAWADRARSLLAAQQLDQPVLLDHMPQFLEDLADYVGEVRAGHDAGPSNKYARIHALDRLDLGFDVGEVVAEYGILREALVELILAKLSPAARSAEMPRLHAAIDLAVSESVRQYMAARERTLRALNRISEAALDQADVVGFLNKLLTVMSETSPSVDVVKVMLRDDDHLVLRAAVGLDQDLARDFRLRIGEGLSGKVAAERKAMTLQATDSSRDEVQSEVLRARSPRVLYGIPLLHREDLVGVALMGSTTAFQFSDEDRLLFRTMADRATAIIVQGQLLERERAARAEAQELASALEAREQQLRASLAFRDEVMGILSHDLRNPLNVVRLGVQSMAREPLTEGQSQSAKRVLSNADRIDRMIRDLLDYTRVRGGISIVRAPVVLEEVCREILDAMQSLHPQRTFKLEVAGDTRGEWDRDRVMRAVSNLVSNAVAYGAEDTPITVSVIDHGDAVLVRIHNEGKPIAPENISRIFEPFTRAADAATADRQGLGLGLYIVAEIVRAHGGSVDVQSNAEQGTTFTVRLPRD